VLAVGFIPNWLLMVRRPEDLGLLPDAGLIRPTTGSAATATLFEPTFTRAQAMRTPAFWLLCSFTLLAFPVQAGTSLHQAPYLIERGINPTIAATIVATFSFVSGVSSIAFGAVARVVPMRYGLSLTGALECAAMLAMLRITTPADGYLAAAIFGAAVGGLMTLLPIAWADYFGRSSYGAVRGTALTVQVLGQACGPVLSGAGPYWQLCALIEELRGARRPLGGYSGYGPGSPHLGQHDPQQGFPAAPLKPDQSGPRWRRRPTRSICA
jgi:MFS transporter, OFA family, oxalate/formate antiporter